MATAAERDFVPDVYHPGNWRKFVDFGGGTLGDMGVHIFDTPYAALKLTAPMSEALLLGVVANRFPGKTLHWNAQRFEISNLPEACRRFQGTR